MVEAFSRSACILLQAALLIPPAVPRGFPTVPVAWGNPSPSLEKTKIMASVPITAAAAAAKSLQSPSGPVP